MRKSHKKNGTRPRRLHGRDMQDKHRLRQQNTHTPKVRVVSGLNSKQFMKVDFDRRTKIGQLYDQHVAILTDHLGGKDNISEPERILIDQAVRFELLRQIAWHEIGKRGLIKGNKLSPALEAYTKLARESRNTLMLIGIKRLPKQIPTLEEAGYIEGEQS